MLTPSGAPRPAKSDFLAKVRLGAIQALEPEIDLTCKVAVLTAAGYGKSEVSRRVGATGAQLKAAFDRAAQVAENLDIAPNA